MIRSRLNRLLKRFIEGDYLKIISEGPYPFKCLCGRDRFYIPDMIDIADGRFLPGYMNKDACGIVDGDRVEYLVVTWQDAELQEPAQADEDVIQLVAGTGLRVPHHDRGPEDGYRHAACPRCGQQLLADPLALRVAEWHAGRPVRQVVLKERPGHVRADENIDRGHVMDELDLCG